MYLNVAPNPAAGLSGPRFIALPTIITPRAVVRGMGVLMLRGMGAKIPPPNNYPFRRAPGFGRLRGFRGLGVSYDQAYNILAQDTLSAVNNGSFASGAAFAAGVGQDVMGICSQLASFDQVNGKDEACPPDMQQQIAAAAASYDAWLKGQAYVPPPSYANSNYGQVPDVYYFNAPPGYQKNPYTGQLEAIPGWPQSVSGYATAANTAVGQQVTQQQQQQSQPAGQSLGVRIENLTSGSTSQFKVGDQWRLTITGPANSPVTGSSNHNGQSNAAAPFGNTNASGVAVLTGSMAADTVGNWSEQWFVGGQSAGSVSFTVTAAAAPAPSGSGSGSQQQQQQQQQQTNTGGGSGSTGQQQQQKQTGGGGGSTSIDLSSLSNQTSLAGFSLPLWGWLAIAGVGVYAVSRGKG